MLTGEPDPALLPRRVVPLGSGPGAPLWAAGRTRGGALWFSNVADLPPAHRGDQGGQGLVDSLAFLPGGGRDAMGYGAVMRFHGKWTKLYE